MGSQIARHNLTILASNVASNKEIAVQRLAGSGEMTTAVGNATARETERLCHRPETDEEPQVDGHGQCHDRREPTTRRAPARP